MSRDESPDASKRPILPGERLTHVDALRGAALLGILIVNLLAFSGPTFLYARPLSWWQGIDRWLEWGVLIGAEGAFYTMFSILFGWGFGRWIRTRDTGARGRFARRLAWLLVFGLIHLFGIWIGDILTHYALIGFLLLPFARLGARASALWGAGLWITGVLMFSGLGAAPEASEPQRWVTLYGSGTLESISAARVEQAVGSVVSVVAYLPSILGLFLLGAALAKSRAFERAREPGGVRGWWIRSASIAVPIGMTVKAVYAMQLLEGGATQRLFLSTSLGGPILGVGYMALLTLWFTSQDRPKWAIRIERALATAGRTALTVYLTQSIVMTGIFYGYGLGLYGSVGPSVGLPIALVLFSLQVSAARWWLARFRFGPLEWLWRSLTYGQLQPWRRERPDQADADE